MNAMSDEKFEISYPAIYAGTKKSEISFFNGVPNLLAIFNPGSETDGPRRFFVTDATVASLDCMKSFISEFDDGVCGKDRLIILGSGEPYKTIESVLEIIRNALDADFSRKDVFVGIGGGVICDLTAFAASIYKRGTSVQLVPTTLLAMVDAAIGGKTGCDFDSYKNMIGSFFPATHLYFFPEFVQYLPENQYFSGLGEAIKTAILFDKELFELFETKSEEIKKRDRNLLDEIILHCVKAKSEVVEKDFLEQNIRATLNLGHTFGHALESIAGLGTITHGEAVMWGIGRAICVSCNKSYCLESTKDKFLNILTLYGYETGTVPKIVQGGAIGERFAKAMHKDKKNLNSKIRLIIPKDVGDIVIEEVEDSEIMAVLK